MSQTQDFDPYYTWLGIPPDEQPPNHYRLLGLKPLETNADVIANAADRQVRHVRTYQSGKHADQSQEVLNKLSAARVCLLNVQAKAEYDEQLAKKLKPAAAAPARAASRSGTKLVTATALEDPDPRPAPGGITPLAVMPQATGPLGGPQMSPGMHPAGPHGPHGPGPHGPMPMAAPAQGVPPWMILAGIGGGVLLLLIVGGAALAFMLGGKPNPPVVMPGQQPNPFVRPNPRPSPPNPFVPIGPMPGGPAERPRMVAGAQDGHPSDPSVTLGLIGEIRFGPAQVLVRYRLGETIDGAVFEKLRKDNNWPPIPLQLRLTGSLEIPQPTKALARLDVQGTTPRASNLRVAHRPWIRHSLPQSGSETYEGDLPGGTTTVEWTIDDVTTGQWKLDLVNASDQMRVPVAVPSAQLSSMRASNRGTELLFAAKPLVVSNQGGSFTATEFGAAVAAPPVGTPVAPGNLQPPLPSDAVAGADDDLNATTGLLGRLQINGQDVGVLVRYRLGGVLTQTKLNEVLQALNIPNGNQRLELTSTLAVGAITVDIRQRTGAYGEVELHDPRLRILNRAGRGNPSDVTRAITFASAGSGKYRWELDGNDFGDSQLLLTDKASGAGLQVYYTKTELDDARRQATTLCEMVVLPDRILFRDKETLVAAVPKDPTAPTGDDAVVRGDEEDPATTTGLIGRLFIDGQDVGVVFRYRLGRSFNSGWFDDIRRQLNLPAGMPELVLAGTIDIPKPRAFSSSGKSVHVKMTGGTRNAGTSQLTVGASQRLNLGGNSYQTDGTDFSYLQPGRHEVKWTIRGAPIGDCMLTMNTTDGQKVDVAYSTNDLKAARKLPLKQEFVLAPKNTLAMRYAGGRLVGTTKISTDPTAGPGTIVVAPMADPGAPAAKREAIPTDEKLKGAEALVKDVFGKDLDAAKSVPEKAALAKKLLQSSRETSDDLAARYVLLTRCKDFAAASGDTVTMCSAIDELDGAYEVDGLKLKSSGFFQASNAALPPTEFGPMTREVLDLIDATIADDRFDLAIKLVDVAGECARRSKDKDLAKQAGDKKRDVVAFKKQFETIDTAQQKLKESPDDGEANLTLGKYRALVKGDWTTGLPHLAKGSDGVIAAAAKLDAAGATDKDARVKLGDAWWDLGEKADAEEQLGYKLRAHTWYKQALPELSGVAQLRVEKRIGEVDEEAGKQAARSKPAAGGGNRPQPGLVVRVYDRDPTQNRPTHMVAVVSDSDEINRWVEAAVRDETTKLGTSISSYYVSSGFIYLTANTTVAIDVTYAAISIDNRAVTDANYSAKQFQIPLTRGMHPITIVCNNSSSMRFTIVDQKSGTNVLYYDAKQLQAELGRMVNGPRGQVKSSLLQRKADPRGPGF